MNRRRRVVLAVLAAALAGGGLAVALDPSARVQGWVGGEPFFQGRSATAWRRDLRQSDEVAATAAQKALIDGKGEAVCGWLLTHGAEDPVRIRAVDALRQMGTDAAPAGPALVAALSDGEKHVSTVAAQTIEVLAREKAGPKPDDALPALVKLFPNPAAIRAVAAYGSAAAGVVPQLVPLLKNPEVPVRRQAVRALGKIGEPAKSAVPDVIALVESDPDAGVQEQAAEALGDIGPSIAAEAVPVLVKALQHTDTMVRRDAVRSLGQMGTAAKGVIDDVRALLKDPEDKVRDAAGKSVRQIDPTGKQ